MYHNIFPSNSDLYSLLYQRPPVDRFSELEHIILKKLKVEERAPEFLDQDLEDTETASTPSKNSDREDQHRLLIPRPRKHPNDFIQKNNVWMEGSRLQYDQPILDPIQTYSLSQFQNPWRFPGDERSSQYQTLQFAFQNQVLLESVSKQTAKSFELTLACIEGIKKIKEVNGNSKASPLKAMELLKCENKSVSCPTPLLLFNHIFGGSSLYKYKLVLDCEIPNPILREKNIVIKAKLVDIMTEEPVSNTNKVLVHLIMQTWEIPSNPISRNKNGNKAIMGETEVELVKGELAFNRIQMNEVTSKFIYGFVALIMVPIKPANYGTSLSENQMSSGFVHFQEIKPLMLERIKVQSKKKKKKIPVNRSLGL